MIDAGIFNPAGETGPTRHAGSTILGRLTTTDEQRAEAVKFAESYALEHKADAVKMTVSWTRGEQTILEVGMSVEHFDGKRIWIADEIHEYEIDGGEIQRDEGSRYRTLQVEVAELHEKGML